MVEAIDAELGDNDFVRRSATADDGAFLLCSFWLAEALALIGKDERAHEVFAQACSAANELGLLPEEVDPTSGEARGNTPLALSHAGLVHAATRLEALTAKAVA